MQKMKYKMNKIFIIQIVFIMVLTMVLNIIPTKSQAYTQSHKEGINSFPDKYKSDLQKLASLHPNWKFTAFYTGMSWSDFMSKETSSHLKNTVHNGSDSKWKCSCGRVASGYACASNEIISYYADPRNFLTESGIFQFLEMSYNSSVHNQAGVENILKDTFMDKSITFDFEGSQRTMKYSEIIMDAARQTNISPYSIAIKIIQEVGRSGSSSVSGVYPGYEGYYNFFNVGASDGGNAIENGLKYAKDRNWNSPYVSIIEGAKFLSNSYISVGQNTAYFYKFDVVDGQNGVCNHQYMTNVQDPSSQAKNLYNTYAKNNMLNQSLSFIIPVFDNMPGKCDLPSSIDTSDRNTYYVNGTGVALRERPTTNSSKLATLRLNEFVTVLELECAHADGYSWSKIRRSNNSEGYVATCYIDPANTGKNSIAKIENTYIIVVPDKKLDEVLNTLGITSYEINKADGSGASSGDKAATSYKVKDKNENKTYHIATLGDSNGDGVVNSGDLFAIQKHLLGSGVITDDTKKVAADVNRDGSINSGDIFAVQKYLLGTGSITL